MKGKDALDLRANTSWKGLRQAWGNVEAWDV
jgi:hypothetical protein